MCIGCPVWTRLKTPAWLIIAIIDKRSPRTSHLWAEAGFPLKLYTYCLSAALPLVPVLLMNTNISALYILSSLANLARKLSFLWTATTCRRILCLEKPLLCRNWQIIETCKYEPVMYSTSSWISCSLMPGRSKITRSRISWTVLVSLWARLVASYYFLLTYLSVETDSLFSTQLRDQPTS